MANDDHLEILRQGVDVWEKWRDENPNLIPDLQGANLKEANLRWAKLSGVNLYGANLHGINLSMADLSGANLEWAKLSGADLSGADLIRASLDKAILSDADLSAADLRWANLEWANLSNANLNPAKFQLAHRWAKDTDLRWANLSDANLSGANLSGANLSMSQVINTNFDNANLTGAFIQDWNINSQTKLDKVICEYVYTYDDEYFYNKFHPSDDENWEEIARQQSRRPINGNFAPGEFASLYKEILENTDLILRRTLQKAEIPQRRQIDTTINNQGVQFYSNSTIHAWQNLRFRSKTEIKIAEALDRAGVLFLPNSLARLNTPNGRANKEADFLICYNGKWGVLEVDGPHHTAERRVEEQERERIFKRNGIKVVERFDAERCYNNPDEVVQEFFKLIEIGYS